jgi:hypothetical protein
MKRHYNKRVVTVVHQVQAPRTKPTKLLLTISFDILHSISDLRNVKVMEYVDDVVRFRCFIVSSTTMLSRRFVYKMKRYKSDLISK